MLEIHPKLAWLKVGGTAGAAQMRPRYKSTKWDRAQGLGSNKMWVGCYSKRENSELLSQGSQANIRL